MNGLILAIDLGKFNSVCCWYDTSTKSATFLHARTTRADLGRDLTRQPVLGVVFEAGSPTGWVHDLCDDLGIPCRVANGVSKKKAIVALARKEKGTFYFV